MDLGDVVHRRAGLRAIVGQTKQRLDLIKREAQISRAADKAQSIEMRRIIGPIVAIRTSRRRENAALLVEPDRLDIGAGRAREAADGEDFRFQDQTL